MNFLQLTIGSDNFLLNQTFSLLDTFLSSHLFVLDILRRNSFWITPKGEMGKMSIHGKKKEEIQIVENVLVKQRNTYVCLFDKYY